MNDDELTPEQVAAIDADMANGIIIEIGQTLEGYRCRHGDGAAAHAGTPPIMFPEWMQCVIAAAKEAGFEQRAAHAQERPPRVEPEELLRAAAQVNLRSYDNLNDMLTKAAVEITRLRHLFRAAVPGSCDWGDCDLPANGFRESDRGYLPVCDAHTVPGEALARFAGYADWIDVGIAMDELTDVTDHSVLSHLSYAGGSNMLTVGDMRDARVALGGPRERVDEMRKAYNGADYPGTPD